MPIEYGISLLYLLICLIQGPWYFLMVTIPLAAYNLSRYQAKDHKLYFITKGEYKMHYKRMERQFQIKSAVYALLFGSALVMCILTAIDFFRVIWTIAKWKKVCR